MTANGNELKQVPSRRGGFTLLELLLATGVTALVAAAGATLVSAAADASTGTRDVRKTKSQGNYAMQRIANTIRGARGIGQVTSNAITLWVSDPANYDQLNLYETGVIRYDSTNQQIIYDYLQSSGATPATTVATSDFTSAANMSTVMAITDKQSVVWADGVSSCTFSGYPSGTTTRIIDVQFTLGTGVGTCFFQGSAGPKASGDYLFSTQTQLPAPMGSTRKERAYYTRWSGFADLGTLTTVVTVN
jgi:type II secretory pathway pseudopilin PulG